MSSWSRPSGCSSRWPAWTARWPPACWPSEGSTWRTCAICSTPWPEGGADPLGFGAGPAGEGRLGWGAGTTWYRVVGEHRPGKWAVVICHGGPGAAHDYVERIANLSRDGRQCVLYDQLGCGQ